MDFCSVTLKTQRNLEVIEYKCKRPEKDNNKVSIYCSDAYMKPNFKITEELILCKALWDCLVHDKQHYDRMKRRQKKDFSVNNKSREGIKAF